MSDILDRLYPHLPVWAQNAGVSLYGFAYRRERLGGDFDKHVSSFRERDGWSAKQMRDYVEVELRRTVLHAFEQVPYYRERWTKAGFNRTSLARLTIDSLPDLPPTPKRDLRMQPDVFVARDVAERHRLHRYYTSGSTGTPVMMICTSDGHRRFLAAREVRSFGWAGASIRSPRSTLGGRMILSRAGARPPFYRRNWAERHVYFSAYHIAPSHVPGYVEGFNRHRPELLTGYAYSHYLLARMMCEQGLSLDYEPIALVLSSEKLTNEMRRVVRQAFRARAYEEYGAVENCMLATECEHGRLHVSPDFGIIEVVDDRGQPVPPGKEGRILCTGLLNEAQPLIRYDIGDIGTWSPNKCGCGRDQLPVLQEILGRLEDVAIGPDGREMVRFHGIFLDLPHVLEGQVIQESLDQFRVLVVATDDLGEIDERLIRLRFSERLGPVQVQIERVLRLERTERGKFRAVISRLSAEQKEAVRGKVDLDRGAMPVVRRGS